MLFHKLKSQISIFILISLIVVFAFVYLINFKSNEINEKRDNLNVYEIHSNNVKLFLDTCYRDSYFKSLQNVGFHGGLFIKKDKIPNNFVDFTINSNFSYNLLAIENYSFIENISEIENQFNLGIKYFFNECLNNDKNYNLSFNISSIKSNTEIYDNNKIKVNSDILISSNYKNVKKTYSSFNYLDEFSYFNTFRNISKKIVLNILKYPNQICISCNLRLEREYNITILTNELIDQNKSGIIYYLINDNLEYNDVKYYSFLDITGGVKK